MKVPPTCHCKGRDERCGCTLYSDPWLYSLLRSVSVTSASGVDQPKQRPLAAAVIQNQPHRRPQQASGYHITSMQQEPGKTPISHPESESCSPVSAQYLRRCTQKAQHIECPACTTCEQCSQPCASYPWQARAHAATLAAAAACTLTRL